MFQKGCMGKGSVIAFIAFMQKTRSNQLINRIILIVQNSAAHMATTYKKLLEEHKNNEAEAWTSFLVNAQTVF